LIVLTRFALADNLARLQYSQAMHKEASNRFRPLDAEADWPFYDSAYALSTHARARIQPLSESGAQALWRREVSKQPLERHVMLLPDSHWVKPDQPGPNWRAEWSGGVGAEVSAFLQRCFPIASNEPVFFMLTRAWAYEAPIDCFIQHWRPFLALDDEGPLLLHPPSGHYALFGPTGYLSAGIRR